MGLQPFRTGHRVNKGIGLPAHWARSGINEFLQLNTALFVNNMTTGEQRDWLCSKWTQTY